MGCSGTSLEERESYTKLMLSKRIDTLIFVGSIYAGSGGDPSEVAYIKEAAKTTPVFMINAHLEGENIYCAYADDYQATLLLQAEDMTKKYLMLQAIADQENITVSEAEAEEELRADAELYGQAVEDYREMIDEEAFREYLLTQKVLDFLSENAVVTVEQAE